MDAGTVEAALKLKDEMSGVLGQAIGKLGGLTPALGAIGIAGGIAAAGIAAAVGMVVALGNRGSDVGDVAGAFSDLSEATGGDGIKNLEALERGVGGLLSKFELMKPLNAAMSAGLELNARDAETMARAAWVLADAQGKDLKDAYNTVADAMTKGNARSLQSLGVMVEQKGALLELKSANDAVGAATLTAGEKEAQRKAILESLTRVVEDAGEAELDFGEKLARVGVWATNLLDDLALMTAESPVLAAGMDAIGDALEAAFGGDQTKLVEMLVGWIETGAIWLIKLASAGVTTADVLGRVLSGVGVVAGGLVTGIGAIFELVTKGIAETLAIAAKIPLIGDQFSEAARRAGSDAAGLETFRKNAAAATEAMVEGAKGNGAYYDTLDSISSTLDTVEAAMVAAQGTTRAATDDVKKLRDARRDDAAAAAAQAEAAKKAAEELKKQQEAIQAMTEQLTGVTAAKELEVITRAVAAAGGPAKVTAYEYANLAARLSDLRAQGVKLTPELENMADAHDAIATSIQREERRHAAALRAAQDYSDQAMRALTRVADKRKVIGELEQRIFERNATNQMTEFEARRAMLVRWFETELASLDASDAMHAEHVARLQELYSAELQGINTDEIAADIEEADAHAGDFANTLGRVASIFDAIAGASEGLVSTLASFASEGLGVIAQFASGDVLGGVASAIRLIGRAIRELRPEGAKVNDIRDDFLAAKGGAEALEAELVAIGRMDLWQPIMAGPGRIEDIEEAIANAEGATEEFYDALDRLGLSLDDVGSPADRLRRTAAQLASDFEKAARAGFTVEQMVEANVGALNNLIRVAHETGTALPASLRPYIEQLVIAGQLEEDLARQLLGMASPVPWQQMEEAAGRYGISLDELGEKFQQAKLDDAFKQIAADFKLLTDNGVEANVAIGGMKDEVQELVTKAMKLGLSIPESMRPVIQAMIDGGLLVDDMGEKLMDTSRLTFAQTLEGQFESLMLKIDELIDRIANGLVPALGGVSLPDAEGGTGTGATARPRPGVRVTAEDAGITVKEGRETPTIVVNSRLEVDGRTVARSVTRNQPAVLEGAGR